MLYYVGALVEKEEQMAEGTATARIEATKELTLQLLKKVTLPLADYKAAAERVGEIYKIIFRAVAKPRED